MKFRSKPHDVEAMQWDGDEATISKILAWCDGGGFTLSGGGRLRVWRPLMPDGQIPVDAVISEWIVRDPMGNYYVTSDKVFRERYEEMAF